MNRMMPEEAVSRFLTAISPVTETEMLPLLSAVGRYCAGDYAAVYPQPPFDRSPLDGYALCGSDCIRDAAEDRPLVLPVTECVFAGDGRSPTVSPGTAVRIMTGAPLPAGADTVVRQEDTDGGEGRREKDGSYTPGTVRIFRCPESGANHVYAGEDYQRGAVLVHRGEKLGAARIALLASMGYAEVSVLRKLRVSVFSTGSELTAPGTALSPGKIYDLNSFAAAAYVTECGEEVCVAKRLPDEAEKAAEEIRRALSVSDLVITTGGVSVGAKDIMPKVLELLDAECLFDGIAIKPGMPTKGALCKGKPLLCLSGNPGAAYTHLLLFGQALFSGLHGFYELADQNRSTEFEFPARRAKLMERITKPGGCRRLLRAHYEDGVVRFSSGQYSSGVFSGFSDCNCLIDIPEGVGPLPAGVEVKILMTGHGAQAAENGAVRRTPVFFAVSGYKNSGKTTLLEKLVARLSAEGIKTACIKHDGHDFVPDVPGTDSDRLRRAGAYGTAVFSTKRFMAAKETEQITERELAALFPEADLILLEGFKDSAYPKYVCRYPEEKPDEDRAFSMIMEHLGRRPD
ncbi:MAG: molybdopterin-guanine dinucleotide biosynthesis protein B [Eubacteriales bacterium]|nr:molybdopterin-guanine dinucleotide biosynthesis protein B [Eubacteriales bacterium]